MQRKAIVFILLFIIPPSLTWAVSDDYEEQVIRVARTIRCGIEKIHYKEKFDMERYMLNEDEQGFNLAIQALEYLASDKKSEPSLGVKNFLAFAFHVFEKIVSSEHWNRKLMVNKKEDEVVDQDEDCWLNVEYQWKAYALSYCTGEKLIEVDRLNLNDTWETETEIDEKTDKLRDPRNRPAACGKEKIILCYATGYFLEYVLLPLASHLVSSDNDEPSEMRFHSEAD